jgi:xanthine dehydrogenase YagS FAD-binding subunit
MAVAMAVLEPDLEVLGPAGPRSIPFDELYRLPGDRPHADTTLDRDDLVTSLVVPDNPTARRSAYRKVRDRASFAFALVSVAAILEVEDGAIAGVRIALGGVAHKPWRAYRAEEQLVGRPATRAEFTRALDVELDEAKPLSSNGFKIPLVRAVAAQALVGLADEQEAQR